MWTRNFRPTLLPDFETDPEPGITFAIRLIAIARAIFWLATFAAGVALGAWIF